MCLYKSVCMSVSAGVSLPFHSLYKMHKTGYATRGRQNVPLNSFPLNCMIFSHLLWFHVSSRASTLSSYVLFHGLQPRKVTFQDRWHHRRSTRVYQLQLLNVAEKCTLLLNEFRGHNRCTLHSPAFPTIHSSFKKQLGSKQKNSILFYWYLYIFIHLWHNKEDEKDFDAHVHCDSSFQHLFHFIF